MKYNIFGIGGSGAKSVEALVYLSAMGVGPKEINVFLIDPDQANGNLQKTQSIIDIYNNIRDKIHNSKSGDFFFTKINYNSTNFINPLDFISQNQNLRDYLGYGVLDDNERMIVDLLYSDKELDMSLGHGFRGVPSIGSLIMTAMKNGESFQNLKHDYEKNECKSFLFGSIFGGTGASGYPLISQILKNINASNLVGGAVYFPYFSIGKSLDENESIEPDSSTFIHKARGAIPFYSNKDFLRTDTNYVLGDYVYQEIKDNINGGRKQKNKAHYIELFGALACLDFYYNKRDKDFYSIKVSTPTEEDESEDNFNANYDLRLKDLPDTLYIPIKDIFENFGIFVNIIDDIKKLSSNNINLLESISWINEIGLGKDTFKKNEVDFNNLFEFISKFKNWCNDISSLENAKLEIYDKEFNINKLLKDNQKKYAKFTESAYDKIFLDFVDDLDTNRTILENIIFVINEGIRERITNEK